MCCWIKLTLTFSVSSDTRVVCVTPEVPAQHVNQSLTVRLSHPNFGRHVIVARRLFTYRPDPEIHAVHPLISAVE